MPNFPYFKKMLSQAQVVRPPRHRLATFGSSDIQYTLVTDVVGMPDRSRIRMGSVKAERPALITPQNLKERFHGFGTEAQEYAKWLVSQYGEALRGLEYQFKNEPESTRIELLPPDQLLERMVKDFDHGSEYRHAIIRGSDKLWELSVMKFIVEETLASFSYNLQELQERGYFDPEDRTEARRRREIENLIQKARENRALIDVLGKKLKEYELFDSYQDEFFRLLKS